MSIRSSSVGQMSVRAFDQVPPTFPAFTLLLILSVLLVTHFWQSLSRNPDQSLLPHVPTLSVINLESPGRPASLAWLSLLASG